MSVAQLTARELGLFAAIAHKHAGQPLPVMLELAERISHGNCGAWAATYSDRMEPAEPDEIEQWALDYLAGRREMVDDHFGPLAYNMIANDGGAYVAPGVNVPGGQGGQLLAAIRAIEEKCKAWQTREQTAKRLAEEDAASFDDIGPQSYLSGAEVRQRLAAAGASRVIVAEFCVDQSDSQSDYYGGRIVRRVVIGFGTGERESFRQLRRAAGAFPPTANMGPGRDRWQVRVYFEDGPPNSFRHSGTCGPVFSTKAEAEAWIKAEMTKGNDSSDGIRARLHGYVFDCHELENRENYSMGGGNYLGTSRYDGWKVRSFDGWGENQPSTEFFQPTAADLARVREMEAEIKAAKAANPPKSKPKGPFWTKDGRLQADDNEINWPQCFRKRETVEAKQAELAAAGFQTEIRCGRRHNHFYLRRIDGPAATETPTAEPVVVEPDPEPLPEVELLAWI